MSAANSNRGVRVLITGGAGFIGTNVADRLLSEGAGVRIFDSLARRGTESNLQWLREQHPQVEVSIGDIRDAERVSEAVRGVDHVVHLAAQVAVTSSLHDPREDFEVNARGAVNVLEAVRGSPQRPSLVFCSTNKVYGALNDIELRADPQRYEPVNTAIREQGVSEARPLEFHSPYGCSKGAADQYVLDYGRSFGLRTAVLRMSCIYGPHQHGNEDQGWVAHFLRSVLADEPLTLYGDGKQVRDLLFVSDLVDALESVRLNIDALAGQAFNIGGGPHNTLSLLELVAWLERRCNKRLTPARETWRVGDQRYYVSDVGKFRKQTGWWPRVSVSAGLERLYDWLSTHRLSTPAHAQRSAMREGAPL